MPDTFVPPGQEPSRPKGFWETFFGKDPNKGKVRETKDKADEVSISWKRIVRAWSWPVNMEKWPAP